MAGAGYKLFSTGDVLTATDVNTYLMQQTVMVFDDAAARTTALTGVVAEGMLSYLKDTNIVEVYDGSNWVASDDPNAIQNSIVDAKGDLIAASAADTPARLAVGVNNTVLIAASGETTGLKWSNDWTTFTPTWTSTGTTPTLGNGTLTGKYIKIGKLVIAQIYLKFGSTTSGGTGNWRFALPEAAFETVAAITGYPGYAYVEDSGIASYFFAVRRGTAASDVALTRENGSEVSTSVPFTWGTNDFLQFEMAYGVA